VENEMEEKEDEISNVPEINIQPAGLEISAPHHGCASRTLVEHFDAR
jgi:hypothetical protein